MKKYLIIIICLLFSFPFQGEGRERGFKPSNRQTVVLSCDLHCQGCIDKIMKNIAFEKGVKDIVCDLDTKTVTVTYDANKTDVPTLLKAFDKIKKPAKVKDAPQPKEAPESDAQTAASTPY